MISLDEIRQLMEEPGMSDDEAEAIRASCYELADFVLEDWTDLARWASAINAQDACADLASIIIDGHLHDWFVHS